MRNLRPDEAKEGIEPYDVAGAEDVAADAIRKGWLLKRSENSWVGSWQRRWCVLAGYLMYYFESPVSKEPKGILSLDGAMMQLTSRFKADGKPVALEIITKAGRHFYFYGSSPEETNAWLEMVPESAEFPDGSDGARPAALGPLAAEDEKAAMDAEAAQIALAREASMHDEQERLLNAAATQKMLSGKGVPDSYQPEGGGA